MSFLPQENDTIPLDEETRSEAARQLGQATSEAKRRAAQENGKKGGKPKGVPVSEETRQKMRDAKKRQAPATPQEEQVFQQAPNRKVELVVPDWVLDYPHHCYRHGLGINADSFEWLSRLPANSIHAIVTDPPYGVKEYEVDQIEKREAGVGGIWRIPPTLNGHTRAALPRFTALDEKERTILRRYFKDWAIAVLPALRPGAHVFIASNTFLSQLVFSALVEGGLEFRGELIRLVRTLRGGDRPKNAEEEFPDVCSLPRGCYEPWGIFRKPMPRKMKVSECLREYQTGGLRRTPDDKPFGDIIFSERTPKRERAIANHPSIKPQSLMRQIVHAALPLGVGVIVDPFMGSGSTVAAAESMGLCAVGVERYAEYFDMTANAIPALSHLKISSETPAAQLELL